MKIHSLVLLLVFCGALTAYADEGFNVSSFDSEFARNLSKISLGLLEKLYSSNTPGAVNLVISERIKKAIHAVQTFASNPPSPTSFTERRGLEAFDKEPIWLVGDSKHQVCSLIRHQRSYGPLFCPSSKIMESLYVSEPKFQSEQGLYSEVFRAQIRSPRWLTYRAYNLSEGASDAGLNSWANSLSRYRNRASKRLAETSVSDTVRAPSGAVVLHTKYLKPMNQVILKVQSVRVLSKSNLMDTYSEIDALGRIHYLAAHNISDFCAQPIMFYFYSDRTYERSLVNLFRESQVTDYTKFVTEMEFVPGGLLSTLEFTDNWSFAAKKYPSIFNYGEMYTQNIIICENVLFFLPAIWSDARYDEPLLRMEGADLSVPKAYWDSALIRRSQLHISDGMFIEWTFGEWAMAYHTGYQIGDRHWKNFIVQPVDYNRVYQFGDTAFVVGNNVRKIRRIDYGFSNDCKGPDCRLTPRFPSSKLNWPGRENYKNDADLDDEIIATVKAMSFKQMNHELTEQAVAYIVANFEHLDFFNIARKAKYYGLTISFTKEDLIDLQSETYNGRRLLRSMKRQLENSLKMNNVTPYLLMELWCFIRTTDIQMVWLDMFMRYRFDLTMVQARAIVALYKGASYPEVIRSFLPTYVHNWSAVEANLHRFRAKVYRGNPN